MQTYIVKGRPGVWYLDVPDGVGRVAVLHHHCLKDSRYRQGPFSISDRRNQNGKAKQAHSINERELVAISYDNISKTPWKRTDGKWLTFDLGEQIAERLKPSEV